MSAVAKPKRSRERRRDAAEKVCWAVLLMMGIGELEQIPLHLRDILGDPMKEWADLALPKKEK